MRVLVPRSRLKDQSTPEGVLEAVSAWSMEPGVGIWLGGVGETVGRRWPVFNVTASELEAWQFAALPPPNPEAGPGSEEGAAC